MNNRIFVGLFPTGIVYADRKVERHGDYKRLGFLPYSTLALEIEKDCPPALAREIRADAAAYALPGPTDLNRRPDHDPRAGADPQSLTRNSQKRRGGDRVEDRGSGSPGPGRSSVLPR